jgi:DNA (cytosine-5)-methyltransferase 1
VPCQGFSRVGLTSKPSLKKERPPEKEAINKLFMEVIRWTGILKPSIVLLENVPDMGNSKILYENFRVRVRELLEQGFAKLGYSSSTVHLNGADFGLPQVRWRLFFVASRHTKLPADLKRELLRLVGGDADERKTKALPLDVALKGLPALSPGKGSEIAVTAKDYPEAEDLQSAYEKLVYDNPYVVFNHIARPHNEDDMRIIASLRPGETYQQLLLRKPDVVVGRKRKVYSVETFHDKFYRLDPAKPGRTIVSHLAKDGNSFIHPFQDRAITVREAARVQGFPDSFAFLGSRTAQFIQVGNAVPPLVAWGIAEFVKQHLLGGEDG